MSFYKIVIVGVTGCAGDTRREKRNDRAVALLRPPRIFRAWKFREWVKARTWRTRGNRSLGEQPAACVIGKNASCPADFASLGRQKAQHGPCQMGISLTATAPWHRNPTGKHRVWDFFPLSDRTRPANRRQPAQPRRKIRPTPTKTASGIPYWPSRDPIEEEGGLNLYEFVGNDGIDKWDLHGLFGAGGDYEEKINGVKRTIYYAGHKDFVNLSDCGFDYDLEDRRISTTPYLNPQLHFQSYIESATQVQAAIDKCDAGEFQSRMHRLQDYYTHYDKGFRWDPNGPVGIPGSGWGHLFAGSWPDRDNKAWLRAQRDTARWLRVWLDKCYVCKKCNWIRKEPGKTASQQPEVLYRGLPANFDRNAVSKPSE